MSGFSDEAIESYPFADFPPPLNWCRVALEEISVDIGPGFASGKHNSDGAGVPHLRPMNVDREGRIDLNVVKSVAASNGTELREDDILFNNTNSAELVGKTARVSARENGFAFSNHMTRIRPESGVNSSFIARQLHFLWMTGYMKHRCTNHVNQASISSRTLAKTVPVLLPPTSEQSRVVEKLEEVLSDLDAGVAELKAAQKKLAQYRQSLLKAAVEGTLTAEWRQQHPPAETGAQLLQRILAERRVRWETRQLAKFEEQGKAPPKDWQKKYPEPEKPDTSSLPELPQGWVWACLDALIDGGPQNGLYLPASQYGKGIPILRIDDYQIGWHRSRSALNLVDADEKTVEMYALNVRDLVINRVNSMTHLGKSLCIGEAMAGVLFESNMMRLHLSEHVAADYVTFYLGSDLGRERLTSDAKWAVNQASINQQDVKKTPIPFPSQAEQQQIAQLLSSQHEAMERQLTAIGIALKQSTAQRQNILRAAFAGQLVPQDPADAPASVLLERIRAERAANEPLKKPRSRPAKEAA